MGEQSDTSSQDTTSGRRVLIALRTNAGFAVLSLVLSLGVIGDRVGEALWKALFILVAVLLLMVGAALLTAGAEAFAENVAPASARLGVSVLALGVLLAGDSTARLLGLSWLPVGAIGAVMLWLAALLTLVTGWDYLVTGLRHVATPE